MPQYAKTITLMLLGGLVAVLLLLYLVLGQVYVSLYGRGYRFSSTSFGSTLGMLIVLGGVLILAVALRPNKVVASHWGHLIDWFSMPPEQFYTMVEFALKQRDIPGLTITREYLLSGARTRGRIDWTRLDPVSALPGNPFHEQRRYLVVTRGNTQYYLCAAPFGKTFFIAWWELSLSGFLHPGDRTFYEADSAGAFRGIFHAVVLAVYERLTQEHPELQRLTPPIQTPQLARFYV